MQHDPVVGGIAASTSNNIVQALEPHLQAGVQRQVFLKVFVRVRAALDFFQRQAAWRSDRLDPDACDLAQEVRP